MVEIKKKNTFPQGLLIGAFMLSIMILAFMLEIQTLAPQYSTFGTQTLKNPFDHMQMPCNFKLTSTLNLREDECIISNIAQFYNRISISFPFFGTIFYIANWMLIAVLLISLLYSSLCKKEDVMDDIDDVDDEERTRLNDIENN